MIGKKKECKILEYTRLIEENSFEDDEYPKYKSYNQLKKSCNCPSCKS